MNLIKEIRFHISLTVAIVIVALVAVLQFYKGNVYLIFLIFVAGCVGGIINSYMRTRHLSVDVSSLENAKINRLAIMQVYISPLVSGLFGFIFFAFCATGIVGGDLLPSFVGLEEKYTTVGDMIEHIKPAQSIDAAKACLWAFIAGFSERLVPNILDKLASKVDSDT